MKKFTAYKLQFPFGLHVSSGGFGLTKVDNILHNDTIFSAIVNNALKIYDDDFVNDLINSDILLSSAFPYIDNILFFPKPFNFRPNLEDDYTKLKSFKKVKFIGKSVFEKIINNNFVQNEFQFENIISGFWDEKFDTNKNLYNKEFSKSIIRPRCTIDRITNQTEIFNFAELYFADNAGLYFLVDYGNSENLRTKFETVLRFMGDEGIGADRTYGKGLYSLKIQEVELEIPNDYKYQILLSLYNPVSDNNNEFDKIDFDNSYVDIINRAGWITYYQPITIRRQKVNVITEGSILAVKSNSILKGNVIEVGNYFQKPVYRYFKAISLPYIFNE